jgi:hypothetical protein
MTKTADQLHRGDVLLPGREKVVALLPYGGGIELRVALPPRWRKTTVWLVPDKHPFSIQEVETE